MKFNYVKLVALVFVATLAFSVNKAYSRNPYQDTHKLPCTATEASLEDVYDCPVFVGMGHATGMLGEEGRIHENALAQARQIVKQKLSRYVAGGYSVAGSSTTVNGRSRDTSSDDAYDEEAFEAYLNTVKEYCIEWNTDDYSDRTTCFLSIVIPMDELVNNDVLSSRQAQKARQEMKSNTQSLRNKARR